MLNFFFMELSRVLTPHRSMLRRTRRELMRALREHDELTAKRFDGQGDRHSLAYAEELGALDLLEENFSLILKDRDRLLDQMRKAQQDILVVEYEIYSGQLAKDILGVKKIRAALTRLEDRPASTYPGVPEMNRDLKATIQYLEQWLLHVRDLIDKNLKEQYTAINRQAVGEAGQLQTFVFSVNEAKTLMDNLWKLRGEDRKLRKDAGDIGRQENDIAKNLEKLADAEQMQEVAELVGRIVRSREVLQAETRELLAELVEITKEFTESMKVCSDIYNKVFLRDAQALLRRLETQLGWGVPKGSVGTMRAALERHMDEQRKKFDAIAQATARETHKVEDALGM